MRLRIGRDAAKSIRRLDTGTAKAILETLNRITADPFAHHANVTRLTGINDGFRLRHGDLRVLYRVDRNAGEVCVDRVGRRGEVYKG
ncbi:MAG: type II toxin-antitoxin system RelE/ParE family toxin [Alphaproteobacteria bacterium]